MSRVLVVLVLGVAGCGRISFEPVTLDVATDAPTSDAATVRVSFGESGSETYAGVTADTSIQEAFPTQNFGATINVRSGGTPRALALLRFDLSALPGTASAVAGNLRVYVYMDVAGSGRTVDIVRMAEAWDGGSMDAASGVASWDERLPGQPWSGAGATPPSRSTEVLGSLVPDFTDTIYTIPLGPVALAVVDNWIANPADNHGFAFLPPEPGTTGWSFQSSESSRPRPSLELDVVMP